MMTYVLKDGTRIDIENEYPCILCGEVAEQGITETALRFVTESEVFERAVTTEVEGDNIWDEVVCEEIVANDDLIRIELIDETGYTAKIETHFGLLMNTRSILKQSLTWAKAASDLKSPNKFPMN